MIKCCIFDLDGTLLNTLDTIHYYIVKAMDEHGYPAISRDACRSFVGNGARLLIERAMNSVGEFDKERIDEVFLLYNQLYDSEPLYLTAPYEGIVEMLECIKANGIKIVVLSNKPHSATGPLVKEIFGELVDMPSVVYNMLPYIISLVVLAFTSKKSMGPKAAGIPYDKGTR